MKRIILMAAVISLAATTAFAASIKNSKHDLSSMSGGPNKSNSVKELCIFCHTPHNAVVNVPLWNRNNPAASSFKLYTASATLTPATKASAFGANSISLFCMSCHDGGALQGRIAYYGGADAGVKSPQYASGAVAGTGSAADAITSSAKLGTNLTNTHPVAFDYKAAVAVDPAFAAYAVNGNNQLTTVNANGATTPRIVFFGSNKSTVECSSCHAVHDPANKPFLRTTKSGSMICFSCHIK